jgi:hypothetical protein
MPNNPWKPLSSESFRCPKRHKILSSQGVNLISELVFLGLKGGGFPVKEDVLPVLHQETSSLAGLADNDDGASPITILK